MAGEDGNRGKRRGKDGESLGIPVPVGMVCWQRYAGDWRWLGELVGDGAVLLVARGGEGGRGNARFASSVNRVPLLAEAGERGEHAELFLELRLLADAALVSAPNVGKSLLMRRVSQATPLVAEYPYTTREPVLGVVTREWSSFTLVELPGLVYGARTGKGLGNRFLRHLWRARLVLHLVDGSTEDPAATVQEVNEEIGAYEPTFLERPQLMVVNKVDLPLVQARLPELRRQLAPFGLARHFISALTGQGIEELVSHVQQLLQELPPVSQHMARATASRPPTPRYHQPTVTRQGDLFVVSCPRAERLVQLADLRQFPVRLQLRGELAKLGVVNALEEAGIQPGHRVQIGDQELLWE